MPEAIAPAESGAAEAGLVLVNLSMKSVALDRGAEQILEARSHPESKGQLAACLPKEIQEIIQGPQPLALLSRIVYFRAGGNEYSCRAYLLEPQDSFYPHPILALHLQRNSTGSDAVSAVAGKYNLTAREEEVLRGVATGLGTKDLARRLNISPNTVKAFLRLIMVKLGVTTRAELFAKILDSRPNGEETLGRAEVAKEQPAGSFR